MNGKYVNSIHNNNNNNNNINIKQMKKISIVSDSSDAYIYNESTDTYECCHSKIAYNWIFVSNNKLYIKVDNGFKYLNESNYDTCIIYYEDDNYKFAVKESRYFFVLDIHNNKNYYTDIHNNCILPIDTIKKIDDNKYFMHNSLDTGMCVQIIDDKLKMLKCYAACLECNFSNKDRLYLCEGTNEYCNTRNTVNLCPYILTYSYNKSYIPCFFEKIQGYKYVSTKLTKNIRNSDDIIKKEMIISSAQNGFEQIMYNRNIKASFSKYVPFMDLIISSNTTPNTYIYYDGIYNKEYFIYLNFEGNCEAYKIAYYSDYPASFSSHYKNPEKIFRIDIQLFPLGIIYATVSKMQFHNHYFLIIILIDGSCHEYIVSNNSNKTDNNINTYSYQKKEIPDSQLIKINNQNKFQILNSVAKIQLNTFILVLKRNQIKIPTFISRHIMEFSLI